MLELANILGKSISHLTITNSRTVPIFQIKKPRLGQTNAPKVTQFASGRSETRTQKPAFSAGRPLTPPPGRIPAPALTSPRKAAHRITVMNQRSMLPAWRLRREPATTTASFSAAASAPRSRCPAAGAPAPRSSSSNSSSAAQEKRSCCRPASQRSLGHWEPSPGSAPAGPAVPAGATSPGTAPWSGRGSRTSGKRRVLQAGDASPSAGKVPEGVTWRKCGLSPTAASLKPEVYVVAWETGRGRPGRRITHS